MCHIQHVLYSLVPKTHDRYMPIEWRFDPLHVSRGHYAVKRSTSSDSYASTTAPAKPPFHLQGELFLPSRLSTLHTSRGATECDAIELHSPLTILLGNTDTIEVTLVYCVYQLLLL